MASFRQLERRLGEISRNLQTGIERYGRELIVQIGRRVVLRTPVDTGYARGNWQPSLNAPITNPIAFLDPTGQATVAKVETLANRFRQGDVAYLVNNCEYIGALNAGHSPQAEPDYIQHAVDEGISAAKASLELRL